MATPGSNKGTRGGRSSAKKRGSKGAGDYNALPLQVQDPPAFSLSGMLSALSLRHPTSNIVSSECVGILDLPTKSVWVVNAVDTRILWERGFFGKGSLSRSEPTWLKRRTNELSGQRNAQGFTAEEMTAKRRMEREKFKSDRAEAILKAQAQAEANFEAGILPDNLLSSPSGASTPAVPTPAPAGAPPSGTTAMPSLSEVAEVDPEGGVTSLRSPNEPGSIALGETPHEAKTVEPSQPQESLEAPVDMEHLQLTLSEAFFCSWALGCLKILDPATESYLDVPNLLDKCMGAYLPFNPPDLARRPDNPFLVHYAVYHYYRSLGWVVRGGIKFCVDYLLYKKGPAFHHAEFALVVCPVYEDPTDSASSPFHLEHSRPMDWAWFSTMNRVNSQVKKTLILVYVTIPSLERMANTSISFNSPECVSTYSVREVVVRRFIPARMRD